MSQPQPQPQSHDLVVERPESGTDFYAYATPDGRVLLALVGAATGSGTSLEMSSAEAMGMAEALALAAGTARGMVEGN